MQLLLLGVDHRNAPLALRERLALAPDAAGSLIRAGLARNAWAEACVLNTCNRTEVYVAAPQPAVAERELRDLLARRAGEDLLKDRGVRAFGPDAVRHLLRVAAGLESLVLGETQVLGQLKQALALARLAGGIGPRLDRLFAAALHAGKRARSETAISAGAVSVASVAVALAERETSGLRGRCVLVLGAGENGRLLALHASEKRPGRLLVVNRTLETAERLAASCGGEAAPLAALAERLAEADVLLAAARSPEPLLGAAVVRAALQRRGGRPLLIVDVAVPRNVEAASGDVPGVRLVTLDQLEQRAVRGLEQRRQQARRAAEIVEEECGEYWAWQGGLEATPVLRELRERFEEVRRSEVARSLRRFGPEQREEVEKLTRALVSKLLHVPTTRLREADAGSQAGSALVASARALFGLRGGEGADGGR